MKQFPSAGVDLLRRLLKLRAGKSSAEWSPALLKLAEAAVAKIPEIEKTPASGYWGDEDGNEDEATSDDLENEQDEGGEKEGSIMAPEEQDEDLTWQGPQKAKPVDSSLIVGILEVLSELKAQPLRDAAPTAFASRPAVFDPVKVLAPALADLRQRHGDAPTSDSAFQRLWHHAADFLLDRSEHPPEPPKDWHQEVTINCRCSSCRALEHFAQNPAEQVRRFPAATELRRHLHSTIDSQHLDMTHETERRGRPYTLVCTKTRWSFERRCREYHEEIGAMKVLLRFSPEPAAEPGGKKARLTAAIARSHGTPRPPRPPKRRFNG